MEKTFHERLAALRRARKLSQRQAAADLGISQALLSHYENGAREPGLHFVCLACDYYGVTADYLLGRASHPGDVSLRDSKRFLSDLRSLVDRAEAALQTVEGEEL